MSRGGGLESGSAMLEVRRERCRYVKGGLRMVILLCVADGFDSNCTTSAETDAITVTQIVKSR